MKRCIKPVCFLLILSMALCSAPNVTYAKSTKEQLEDAEKEKKKTEKDVKDAKDNVGILNARQKKLQGKLSDLNDDLEDIATRLSQLDEMIRDKEDEIYETTLALDQAQKLETEQYESMKKRIQFMYENSSSLYLDILFKAKSFSDFITLNNYIDSLAEYDNQKFAEYEANRHAVEQLKAHLVEEKLNLDALHDNASKEKESISVVINNTALDISEYNDLIDDAEKELLAKEEELKAQENNIAALKKKYEEELEKSRRSREAKWRDISEVEFDDGDRMLLANLIYCEAGGEPYDGQVAVGAVVINRVLTSVFPDTVSGVIYQSGQFSPAASGRLAYALSVDKATDSCYRAADEAMSGYTNVGSCVYFRTPIPGLSGIRIGNHIFY